MYFRFLEIAFLIGFSEMPSIKAQNVSLRFRVYDNADGMISPKGAGQISTTQGAKRWVNALKGVSFDLSDGKRLGLIGRNGSGKSTLLKAIAGLLPVTSGHIDVDGEISALIDIAHGMRIEATGERNIILRGMIAGLSKADAKARVLEIAAFAELEDYIRMPVRTYSSGMAMRLNFAIATAFEPDILIVDEWLGAGDRIFQQKAQKRMHSLVDRSGALVLASHDLALIEHQTDEALWLDAGRVEAAGASGDVVSQYMKATR
ncbi:ABC transporter ATP-binding protein [Hyphobacterium sp. HN65]|uniref:ABC transporter ATP-binding protein n=1 Tax=Hyphobacterium lacteum TaxID=3116575 RepID=A0ABU7LPN2_9PROT|nr:ABC transporter ATP-binding protein [Hyphobacterium sp. HN65]MEE2525855.1 ABC transporter ATP-binding protein [Hyphobacterium sp. HN65]